VTKVIGIYSITHMLSGRIYVGSSVNVARRWYLHRKELDAGVHHSDRLQKAWAKYGPQAFIFTLLESVVAPSALLQREQHWMDTLQSFKRNRGYNIVATAGSTLGRRHSPATKLKLAAVQLGRKHTQQHIEANRKAQTGKKRSPETCARIGAIHAGAKRSPETRTKIAAARTGSKASPETKAKMSAAKRGIKRSAECCIKMAIANTGKRHSAETRAKISASRSAAMTPELRHKYREATLRFYATR
jgi:group I intron endonuclease